MVRKLSSFSSLRNSRNLRGPSKTNRNGMPDMKTPTTCEVHMNRSPDDANRCNPTSSGSHDSSLSGTSASAHPHSSATSMPRIMCRFAQKTLGGKLRPILDSISHIVHTTLFEEAQQQHVMAANLKSGQTASAFGKCRTSCADSLEFGLEKSASFSSQAAAEQEPWA